MSTARIDNCCGCGRYGFKTVQAERWWHGVFAFGTASPTACSCEDTKYLKLEARLTGTWTNDTLVTTWEANTVTQVSATSGAIYVYEADAERIDNGTTIDNSVAGWLSTSGETGLARAFMEARPDENGDWVMGSHNDAAAWADMLNGGTEPAGEDWTVTITTKTATDLVISASRTIIAGGLNGSDVVTSLSMEAHLTVANTAASVEADARSLLGEWPMDSDEDFEWRTDNWCTASRLVSRDEVQSAVPPWGSVVWGYDTGYQTEETGDIIGGPGDELQSSREADAWPDGACIIWEDVQRTRMQKRAIIKLSHDQHNWFRPCGTDRNDARFTTIAWPICGCASVESATQNGSAVDIVLDADDAARAVLQTGDSVTFSGVGSLTTHTITALTDSAHWSVTATLGSYTSGGTAKSTGAPDCSWDDTTPRGDFVYQDFDFDLCDDTIAFSCTTYNLDPSPVPAVMCISPNEEYWENYVTIGFPEANLIPEGTNGARWQGMVHGVLPDPFDAGIYVEARCAPPPGAPDLPEGYSFGCADEVECPPPEESACWTSEEWPPAMMKAAPAKPAAGPTLSPEEINARHAACLACDKYVAWEERCKLCGGANCIARRRASPRASCPARPPHWGPIKK